MIRGKNEMTMSILVFEESEILTPEEEVTILMEVIAPNNFKLKLLCY